MNTKRDPYTANTARMADLLGGRVISLAGGYVGAMFDDTGDDWYWAAPDPECPGGTWLLVYCREDDDGAREGVEIPWQAWATLPDAIRAAQDEAKAQTPR